MIVRLLAFIIGSIVTVLAVSTIFPDEFIVYKNDSAVVIFGVVLGLLTAFIKPIVRVLTLPLSCLTFGAIALVINAALFWAAARLTPDLDVTYLGAAVGGIFAAVINGVIFSVADEK